MQTGTITTIDQYIAGFPEETKALLGQMRTTILNAAPGADETISYGMPTFRLNGVLVHFAGYKHHIGFYPTPSAISEFMKELSVFKSSKGAVQFPIDHKLPIALITRIVKFRVMENEAKAKKKIK